jgi:outer membrane protein TolC
MTTFLLLPLLLSAAAPDPCASIDLPSALSLVARRSDEVAIKESDVEVAASDQSIARAVQWIPEATATLVFGPVPGAHGDVVRALDETTNRSLHDLSAFGRVDVNLVQPIYTWGQLTDARDAANAGFNARSLLVKDEVATVQLRVIQLYWAQAMAHKLLGIAADVEDSLSVVDEKISEALKNQEGDITLEDKYRVKLFEGELESRKADAQQALDQAQIGLSATLAMDPQKAKFDAPPLDTSGPAIPPLQKLLELAESQRPDLKALDQAIAAREAEVRADNAAMLPAIFLAGEFSYAYAPNRDIQLNPWVNDPFNELSAGIVLGARQNLAFPLLIAQRNKAGAELSQMQLQRRGLVRLIDTQVESAFAESRTARSKLDAALGALGSGKAWFRSAALNFGLGVDDAKTLLESYQGFVESQVNLASASYAMLVARAKLAELTGQPLSQGEGKCVSP